MSENDDQHQPLHERSSTDATTEDLEWESMEDEHASAEQPSPGERTIIHLPNKRRVSITRRARRAADATHEPARTRQDRGPSRTAPRAAVILAAFAAGAIALAIHSPRGYLRMPRTSTSAKLSTAPRQPDTQRKHQRGALRRAQKVTVKLTLTRAHSDNGVRALPQPPASRAMVSTAPPPAPERQTGAEGQPPGGPFSP
jgi:hypothetical protein